MNFKHTLSTLLFYRLLSLCLCAYFGLSCLFFFFPFGELNDGVLVGHSVLRGSQKSLWRSPYLNSGHCRNKFFFAQMAKTLISKSNLEVLAFLLEILQGIPYLRSFVFGRLVFLVISVFFSRKVCFFL